MPLHADDIRLRAPVPMDVYERLKNRPRLLRGAQLAQPALLPAHPLPLVVGFWDDTPQVVWDAGKRAMDAWNKRMAQHTSAQRVFVELEYTTLQADIMVGVKPFDTPDDFEAEFGHVGGGVFGGHTFGQPFGASNAELGDCELFWDEDYRIVCGRIFVPDDILNERDLWGLLAHELGHALLLGHDPSTPSRLMYRHFGGVVAPKKIECHWVEEIWS